MRDEIVSMSLTDTPLTLWFIAQDSEADGYPTGAERKHWNKVALKLKDEKMRELFSDVPSELPGKIQALRNLAWELKTELFQQ